MSHYKQPGRKVCNQEGHHMKLSTTLILSTLTLATSAAFAADQPVIGLITKTETNPFFVKMKEGAQAQAKKDGATVQSFAGKKDGDNESQVAAVENLISSGAKGFMITP